jgi:glucose/arabinose dehydrogenase
MGCITGKGIASKRALLAAEERHGSKRQAAPALYLPDGQAERCVKRSLVFSALTNPRSRARAHLPSFFVTSINFLEPKARAGPLTLETNPDKSQSFFALRDESVGKTLEIDMQTKVPQPFYSKTFVANLPVMPLVILWTGLSVGSAGTIWNGPSITFSKAPAADPAEAANQDRITSNTWVTRGSSQGIYNAKTEGGYTHNFSPSNTVWAIGTTANTNLTYQSWEETFGSFANLQANIVGQDCVVHLLAEDIYLDIKFTVWGNSGAGAPFAYQRSTPSPNVPPTVAITSPANGATLAAPANPTIVADASDFGGLVSNVQFLDGTNSLGNDTTPPFSINATLYPGARSLRAVVTDNEGLSVTSTIVSVTVTNTVLANPIAAVIPKGDVTVELKTVAAGMVSPLGMAVPDDGSGRMFVYDQAGFVWLVTTAGRSTTPVLDLRNRLVNLTGTYDERGLLGLAAHTNFAQHPYLYTYTSEFNSGAADFPTVLQLGGTNNHQSVIAEWRMSLADSNVVDLTTRRELVRIDQPQSNHNGGTMRFGPDGFLYIALGDGGQANDAGNGHTPVTGNGQDTNNILGSFIRIDVNGSNSANGQYGVPAGNPFVGVPGVDEIFAWGLRNPFTFSFDRGTGQLWAGDVGQAKVEEINVITNGGNYGWNLREGTFWFDGAGNVVTAPVRQPPAGMIDPVAQYDHDDGTAVIGGTVYRGSQLSALVGRYVFGDWGFFGSPSGRLFYLDSGNEVKELRLGLDDRPLGLYLKGFGEDAAGEVYIFATLGQGPTGNNGVMLKLVPPPAGPVMITGQTVTNGSSFFATWSGGVGPFAQQRKATLGEAIWMNDGYTAGNSITGAIRGNASFFREVDTANQLTMPLTISLTGTGSGTGSGIMRLTGNTLKFSVSYSGLSGTATQAHIHGPATTSGSAGVLVDLAPFNGGVFGAGGALAGTVVLTDIQKAHLLAGRTYINIHTAANPSGEIRGQIAPVLMQASMLGEYETGQIVTPASGLATFMLVGTQLTYSASFKGLSGPATAGHLHGPAPLGQDAGVLVGLPVPVASSGSFSGTIGLTPSQLAAVIDGQTYVNLHTAANPGGEIRGQVVAKPTAVPFTAWISGLNERPTPLVNSATGLGLFSLEGNSLFFNITYAGLSGVATDAHLHGPAAASGSVGVQIGLAAYADGGFSTAGSLTGVVPLTAAQRTMLLNGQLYFNIHTSANPPGEARGQVTPVSMLAEADGAAERPTAVISPGNATGLFALVGNQLDLNITYRALSGTASDAHLHGPATTSATAGVLVGFSPFNGGAFGSAGSVVGSTVLSAANLASVIDQLTYINFHTGTNPSGEIRGQVLR